MSLPGPGYAQVHNSILFSLSLSLSLSRSLSLSPLPASGIIGRLHFDQTTWSHLNRRITTAPSIPDVVVAEADGRRQHVTRRQDRSQASGIVFSHLSDDI